ncbi:MAG: argininosuccinate lyase [Candidatus Omnitrophota bacterium]
MTKKLWGGRFTKKTDPLVEEFTKSIQYDYKLAKYDVLGSMYHIKVLREAGIISSKEFKQLLNGLSNIMEEIKSNKFRPDKKVEDIHTDIQNRLEKAVGVTALRLHTARSRNEQVVFDVKVYCVHEGSNVVKLIEELAKQINAFSQSNKNIILPGFTHMQHAQPVVLSQYISAYEYMLERDVKRLSNAIKEIKYPIGSGALAGTMIEKKCYDKAAEKWSKETGHSFIAFTENSVDNVSDRDFVIEIISALSLVATHLSRLAEDLIIWSTKEFDFVEIDEAFCTGSSLMPQKKNPDVLELVRGYAGRLYGNLVSVLTMMKGLPLTYNRDMQLDKEPLFNSFEIVSSELKVLAGLMKTLKFNKEKIEEQLKDESLYATDLVYYLVIEKKEPFAIAHAIIGKLVKYSLDNNLLIKNMTQDQLDKFSKKLIKEEIVKLFDPKVSVESKKSILRKDN